MDEFVSLTERYGLKPRGKSAPMAALKRSGFSHNSVKASPFDSGDDSNAELTLNDSKFDLLNPGGLDDFLVFDELIKLSTNDSDDGLTGLGTKEKSSNQNSSEDGFDELIPGFGGSSQPSNNEFQETEDVQVSKQQFGVDDNLESLFIPGPTYSWGSPGAQAQFLDDLSPLFGAGSLPVESEELPEENDRITETLDAEIKLWATGKEGNLRALISSLHLVLWPGCGWEAVSLTDLIASAAVKKLYRKATLYVHPDKVHQKGAQQKYIAEKVFKILQEAWNKFKKEELS